MTTIKLHIPDDLVEKVNRSGNAQKYIIDLIRNSVDKPKPLKYEYQVTGLGNVTQMKEVTLTDLEIWNDEY